MKGVIKGSVVTLPVKSYCSRTPAGVWYCGGGDNTACKTDWCRTAAVEAVKGAVEGAEVPSAGLCPPSTSMLLEVSIWSGSPHTKGCVVL